MLGSQSEIYPEQFRFISPFDYELTLGPLNDPIRSSVKMSTPADLYLDLLKRSLSNTIFDSEPEIDDDEFRFTMLRAQHYVDSDAVSMIPLARFDNIQNCIADILRN